jgi:predicted glutamine amidotransferase
MCELLAMSSLRPARLTFSLETLAAHGAAPGRNRDGWGAAFYQDRDVALFREPRAAGDSPMVRFLETQGPSTTLAISHIRRATRGAISLSNTQPFAEGELMAVSSGQLVKAVKP